MSAGARLPSTPEPTRYWPGSGGVTIAGDEWGDPDGPLVILQHGGGQTRHAWKNAGETLGAAGYRAVAFDARGHGDSDWAPDGDYSQAASVRDLRSVVEALGDARPALIGASMGGGTSLTAVGEGHIKATALVLVDIAPRIDPDGVAGIRAFMAQKPEGFETLEEVADAISAYQPHRPRPRRLDGLAKNVRLGDDGRYHWHWDPRTFGENGKRIDLEERRRHMEACARAIDIPTLLVRGGMSDVLTEEGAQEFLAMCPHAEYVSVPDAAHMVAGDRNDVFADSVIDFLRRSIPVEVPGGATATAPSEPSDAGRRYDVP